MPNPHAAVEALSNKEERLAAKAQFYADELDGLEATQGDYDLTVATASVSVVNGMAVLELTGVVLLDTAVDLEVDDHQRIINPPLLKKDVGGAIVRKGGNHAEVDPTEWLIDLLVAQ